MYLVVEKNDGDTLVNKLGNGFCYSTSPGEKLSLVDNSGAVANLPMNRDGDNLVVTLNPGHEAVIEKFFCSSASESRFGTAPGNPITENIPVSLNSTLVGEEEPDYNAPASLPDSSFTLMKNQSSVSTISFDPYINDPVAQVANSGQGSSSAGATSASNFAGTTAVPSSIYLTNIVNNLENIVNEIGNGLNDLENPTDGLGEIVDGLGDIVEEIGDTVGDLVDTVDDTVGDVIDTVDDTVGDLVDTVDDTIGDVVDTVDDTVGDLVDTADDTVGDLVDTVDDTAGDLVDTIGDTFGGLGDTLTGSAILSIRARNCRIALQVISEATAPIDGFQGRQVLN
ncbi:MAG: hypothetical protein P1U89_08330 [Verrucomicrobiales bacterium]|nr:hypothetical protein [Verrucomicrobiales bacterium]